jgi:hypothetical protein
LGDLWERAVAGERVRAVVTVPVRFGKSFTMAASMAWGLAMRPELTFANLTYSQKLTDRFSRRIRTYAESAGVEIQPDHNRIEEWRTTKDGGLLSSSVSGPITGYGANIIVIDDPIKGREDAESPTIRDKTWEWITDDVYTRLEPSASMFMVAARWHEDDPIGRVLRGELKGDNFELIHYQAITTDEQGVERSLWEQRWPVEELKRRREAYGGPESRTWLSLYQGEPRPAEGALFRGTTYADEWPDFV